MVTLMSNSTDLFGGYPGNSSGKRPCTRPLWVHLELVLKKLREHKLYAKASKYAFNHEEYEYTMKYVKGKHSLVADALSRRLVVPRRVGPEEGKLRIDNGQTERPTERWKN